MDIRLLLVAGPTGNTRIAGRRSIFPEIGLNVVLSFEGGYEGIAADLDEAECPGTLLMGDPPGISASLGTR
ncbi:MAG TPA: hypothetical protein VGQ81_02175 [Acidobacteriota bacterium]|nr:hypothetical protein [Acidobacteriota bacterium]